MAETSGTYGALDFQHDSVSLGSDNDLVHPRSMSDSVSETLLKFKRGGDGKRSISHNVRELPSSRKFYMTGLGEDLTGFADSKLIIQTSYDNSEDNPGTACSQETPLVPFMDLVLFFICGVGVSAPFTCILSSLTYFSDTFYNDPKVFMYLNVCVYSPTIIISVAQAAWDDSFNVKYGARLAYNTRIIFTYVASALVLFLAPSLTGVKVGSEKTLWHLVLVTFSFGVLHQISYGSFYQIASFIPSDGKCLASFSMGYQGAGFVIFAAQVWSSFGYAPSQVELRHYFEAVAVLELIALVAYLILNCSSTSFNSSMVRQDKGVSSEQFVASKINELKNAARDLEVGCPHPDNAAVNSQRDASTSLLAQGHCTLNEESSLLDVLQYVRAEAISLFCTIFGSIFLLTFYAYIKSDGLLNQQLAKYLFFAKLAFDTISRPLTVLLNVFGNSRQLLYCSVLRLLFIPFFFAYIGGYVRLSDIGILTGVALFSMSSGFFATNAYQFASTAVPPRARVRVASAMSFLFTIGLNAALVCAIIIQETVNLGQFAK